MNAGGWEEWRPDAGEFPTGIIGDYLDDWESERWLYVRRIDILASIMEARMNSCRDKVLDGIEPDNIDGFLNDTGFDLTYEDQLAFKIWLAGAAHARGLSIGLKNEMDQIQDLLAHFDWALNEECFQYDECETPLSFIQAGKAVSNTVRPRWADKINRRSSPARRSGAWQKQSYSTWAASWCTWTGTMSARPWPVSPPKVIRTSWRSSTTARSSNHPCWAN